MNTKILYIATLLSIITYMFWGIMPNGSFYIGNALFINLLCINIFCNNKNSFIAFVLLGYSLNNIFDEIIFNDNKLHISEVLIGIAIPILWFIKKYLQNKLKNNDR